MSLILKNKVKT